jgi:hypothetical protein
MRIIEGFLATTHLDKCGDKLTKECLEDMAEQIKIKPIPLLIEHDPDRKIGYFKEASVVLLEDEEWGLKVSAEIFENIAEKEIQKFKFFSIGHSSKELESAKIQYLSTLESGLNKFIEQTSIWTNGEIYEIKGQIKDKGGELGDIKIKVNSNDHHPLHFHAISKQQQFNAKFTVKEKEDVVEFWKDGGRSSISKDSIKKIIKFFQYPTNFLRLREEINKTYSQQGGF